MSLSLSGITHRYGAVLAVEDATLEVAGGEILCLFGPSGCGKTTLLRVAAGLEKLQAGRVALEGRVLAGDGVDFPPEQRPVGLVFQDYVLFPHLTALENVAFGLVGLPKAARRARARAELAAVGLAGLEESRPDQLSGGQQQRVALARAFARRPRAMLLDEPFASIDAVLRRRLRDEIRRILKARAAATILITHDPEEALALGDRIAIMRAGRILETATPASLFSAPATMEGASLFAGAQRLEGHVADAVLRTAFGDIPAAGQPDGPLVAIIQAGGVAARPDAEGAASAKDCRFVGPGWSVRLGPAGGGPERLAAVSETPAAPGARFHLTFDPARLRFFPIDLALREA